MLLLSNYFYQQLTKNQLWLKLGGHKLDIRFQARLKALN